MKRHASNPRHQAEARQRHAALERAEKREARGKRKERAMEPSQPSADDPLAPDPFLPSIGLLIKLGSALVHAEEALLELKRGGMAAMQFDVDAFTSVAADPEVQLWREAMDAMAFLPVKRH